MLNSKTNIDNNNYSNSITVDNFPYFVNNYLANNLVNSNKFRTFVTEHGTRNTEHLKSISKNKKNFAIAKNFYNLRTSTLTIACPVGADFTSALTTPTGLNVYKKMTQQSCTTPSGSNIPATYSYKYATTTWSNNNRGNHKNKTI